MIINLIIYGTAFIFTYKWFIGAISSWLGTSQPGAGFWLQALNIVLLIIGFILVLFICYLLFVILGGLVTAPFNEELSQRVEEIVTNQQLHKMGFWEDAFISIKGELEKIVFYIVILFIIFLLDFIPVAGNVVAAILGTLFSFYYNALDFLDYPMTRKKMSLRNKLKVTSSAKMLTYGFGCTAFFLMFLPIVNVFMKPILVVAGTSLYYEKDYHKYEN